MWITVKSLVEVVDVDLFIRDIDPKEPIYEWREKAIRPEEVFAFFDNGEGAILLTFYDDSRIVIQGNIAELVKKMNEAQYTQKAKQEPAKTS